MKKLTYIFIIFTFILFFALTFSYDPLMANPRDKLETEKDTCLNILTVNKDIYIMTKDLVADNYNVEYLFNNEKEMENFVLSENIINNILNMDLFIYNGLGYEEWISKVMDASKNSDVGVINASRGIRTIIKSLSKENEENPYYLLGFSEYKIALYNIKTSLQERDIKNRSYYEENYNNIITKLDEFLNKSKEELNNYKNYFIYSNTDRLDYLFRDLGIEVSKLGDNQEEINEENLGNIIFLYDENNEDLNELKNKYGDKYTYVGLSSEASRDTLTKNVTNIMEAIKNKSDISS